MLSMVGSKMRTHRTEGLVGEGGRLGHQAVSVCSGRIGAHVMGRQGEEADNGDVNLLRRWQR